MTSLFDADLEASEEAGRVQAEGAIEPEGHGDEGYDLPGQPVHIGVGEGAVGVLEYGDVGLHHGRGHERGGEHRVQGEEHFSELALGLVIFIPSFGPFFSF